MYEVFTPEDAAYILTIRPKLGEQDRDEWGFTKDGCYTTKSAYRMLSKIHEGNNPPSRRVPPVEKQLWNSIWKLKITPKICHFLWQALSGTLAVAERLQSRDLHTDLRCKACGQAPESICHVFFTCPTAIDVWRLSNIAPPSAGFPQNSVFLNLHYPVAGTKKKQVGSKNSMAFPWILWNLWKNRNALVFEHCRNTPDSCVSKALEEAEILARPGHKQA